MQIICQLIFYRIIKIIAYFLKKIKKTLDNVFNKDYIVYKDYE